MDDLKNLVLSLLLSALNSFDGMLNNAANVLSNSNQDFFDTVLSWSSALKPFCLVIIGICLLLEIAQVAAKADIIKWEYGLRLCVKMVLARLCLDVAPDFLRACYAQSAAWIDAVAPGKGNLSNIGSIASSTLNSQFSDITGLWNVLGLLISTLLLIIAIRVCGLLIEVFAYTRIFEICVYLLISPLPCAFFPLSDGSGDGIGRITAQFFKNFIAVCVQGVMMILCLRIFNTVISSGFSTLYSAAITSGADATVVISDICYAVLLFAVVLVIAVAKCGSWAKGIMDAL